MRLEQRQGSDNSLVWYRKEFCFISGAMGSHHRVSAIEWYAWVSIRTVDSKEGHYLKQTNKQTNKKLTLFHPKDGIEYR